MAPVKAGRYQLLEELGRGAMGVVYKAFDPVIGRSVAVKALRLNATGSGMNPAELVSRFQTETRAAGSLTHANIVSVFDAGEEDGLFYITMEYVEGSSLQDRLDKGQVFPLERILRVMEQACAGLGYAHRRNIVHRDIKPANILLAPDDTLKITDFGTAKILQLGTTQSGHVIGTPSYMSPEQVKGKLVDGRSDIFSLGVILYELITGEKPFPGQNVTTVIYKIVNTEPIPPKELDGSVPAGLNFIVTKALAKDPGMRFATCEELLEALKRYPELGPSTEETVKMARPAVASAAGVSASGAGGAAAAVAPARAPVEASKPAAPVAAASGAAAGIAPTSAKPAARATKSGVRRRPAKTEAAVIALGGEQKAPRNRGMLVKVAGGLAIFLAVAAADLAYLYWPNIRHGVSNRIAEMRGVAEPASGPAAAAPRAGPPAAAPSSAATGSSTDPSAAASSAGTGAANSAPADASHNGAAATKELTRLREQLERRIRDWGLAGKVQVFVSGTEVAVAGILSRAEHNQLVEKMRGMAPAFPWTDHTQIAEGLAGTGKGGVEVLTTIPGAHAVVKNYDGKQVGACDTPCSVKDLAPGNYFVQTNLSGYRPEIRTLDVKGGAYSRTEIKLDALFTSIIVTSEPAGAEIIIDGEKQKDVVTPATIYRSPGKCMVTVRKPGYTAAETAVAGEVNAIYTAKFPMTPSGAAPAAGGAATSTSPGTNAILAARTTGSLNVRTVPPGAEILIPVIGTQYTTPRRLDLAPGEYTVIIILRGYKPVKRTITVTANKETPLNATLSPSNP